MASAACVTSKVEAVEISWDYWSDASKPLSYSVGIAPLASDDLNGTATVPAWQPINPVAMISMAPSSIFRGTTAAAIAARACDAVGLCSESDWSHIYLVDSAPLAGRATITPSWGASDGFLGSSGTQLRASWDGWAQLPPTSVRDLSYEVCVGTTPYGCQLKGFSTVGNATSWQADAGLALPCGSTVFVAVRATNCAGLQRTNASEGAKVCCEAPAGGIVTLLDEHGTRLEFVGNTSHANVSWTGFSDGCSGVRDHTVKVASTDGGIEVWSVTGLDAQARFTVLPADVVGTLSHGAEYTIEVRATSHAGLSRAITTSFRVDRTPPVAVGVFNDQLRNIACQRVSDPIRVSWTSIQDDESGVHSIVWALGSQPFAQDLLSGTRIDGDAGGVAREWADSTGVYLKPGMVVHSMLTVTNQAGGVAIFTPPPVRMVAENCTSSFFCLPSATGVHPLMLPLVLGLAYDVSGKITAPGFMAQRLKMDLRVYLDEVQRTGNGSRLVRLTIGRESIVRDRYGSPVESLLTEDAFTHPMLYEQDPQGTVTHVLHHTHDSVKSLRLKRMLVSAQQLVRISSNDLRSGASTDSSATSTNVPLAFEAFEEDHDGPAHVVYEVRKGLIGRVIYQKLSNWQPTKRRPAIIEQRATTQAILNAQGTLLRMKSEVYYSTNVSKQPLPDGSGVSAEVVEGFDFLPRDPAVFTWKLLTPLLPSPRGSAKPVARRLTSGSFAFPAASFVRAKLHLDDAPEVICKRSRREAYELLNCVLQGDAANTEPSGNEARSQCVRDLVHVMAECEAFGLEARLGAALTSPRCAGPQAAAPRACDAAVSALSLLGSNEAQRHLASFIGGLVPSHLRHENTLAMSSIAKPHHALLDAMATQLEAAKPSAARDNTNDDAHDDAALLIATAALAARARGASGHDRHHLKTMLARIDAQVAARLKECKRTDEQMWAPLYNVTRHSAQSLWSEMAHHQRLGWIGHHAQLDGSAHNWEAERDETNAHRESYVRHIDFANEALEYAHLERHPAYSADKEARHHYRIVTALRAAGNARAPHHASLLVEWLGHSNEAIAVECANALIPQDSELVEQHIFKKVRVAVGCTHLTRPHPGAQRASVHHEATLHCIGYAS